MKLNPGKGNGRLVVTRSRLLVLAAAGLSPLGFMLGTPSSAEPPLPEAKPAAQPDNPKPMVLPTPVEAFLAEKIAKQLVAASPMADPKDPGARDAAGEKLGACKDLIETANGRILWGGFNPEQGYDPEAYRLTDTSRNDLFQLTELNPQVFAKLYLSLFMFNGKYAVRQEGRFTVLEMEAKFRSEMDPGEYPYPFWHTPNKWTAYVHTEKVALVFEPGRLLAGLRVSPPPLALRLEKKKWDGKWTWTDEKGQEQPRVALYSYLFSKDNPHVAALDESFRALAMKFREQNCIQCHTPNNQSRINDLLLLNYPNQALVARRTLVAVLEANKMPPGSIIANEPTGIQSRESLDEMIRLAKAFEQEADDAFAYDQLHAKRRGGEATPETKPGGAEKR